MLKERLQILISSEQRRRLEAEARRQQTSVASLIRAAIDAHFGAVTKEHRLDAVEAIRSLQGRFLRPEDLDQLAEEEREEAAGQIVSP